MVPEPRFLKFVRLAAALSLAVATIPLAVPGASGAMCDSMLNCTPPPNPCTGFSDCEAIPHDCAQTTTGGFVNIVACLSPEGMCATLDEANDHSSTSTCVSANLACDGTCAQATVFGSSCTDVNGVEAQLPSLPKVCFPLACAILTPVARCCSLTDMSRVCFSTPVCVVAGAQTPSQTAEACATSDGCVRAEGHGAVTLENQEDWCLVPPPERAGVTG